MGSFVPADWHQYDDIICMKPPGTFQRILDSFIAGSRKDLVRGKKDAAAVMLDRIFSVLQPWSAINLQSFMTQFLQFFSVVRVPMIHEGRARRPWSSLQYEEKEVPIPHCHQQLWRRQAVSLDQLDAR